MFFKTTPRQRGLTTPAAAPLIYIEEHDTLQLFDSDKGSSFFVRRREANAASRNFKLAAISGNILFSKIPENKNNIYLKKYVKKNFSGKSYFLFENPLGEKGIYYSNSPAVNGYYSIDIPGNYDTVSFVLPYEYLVIIFLRSRTVSSLETPLMFIEETENICKLMVIKEGFSLFPVKIFKRELIRENLGLVISELETGGLTVKNIITNLIMEGDIELLFRDFTVNNFETKDFFEFFGNLDPSVPHFENINEKVEGLLRKKKRLENIYILGLAVLILFIAASSKYIQSKINIKNTGIERVNKKIFIIKNKIREYYLRKALREKINTRNIGANLKRILSIFPDGVKIVKIELSKSDSNFILSGNARVKGNYNKFVAAYNMIIKNPLVRSKTISISYNLKNFGKPFLIFSSVISKNSASLAVAGKVSESYSGKSQPLRSSGRSLPGTGLDEKQN